MHRIIQEGEERWKENLKFIEIERKAYKEYFRAELLSLNLKIVSEKGASQ